MKIYNNEAVQAQAAPIAGEYLLARYQLKEAGPTQITVGRGEEWTPLACKEVYGKAAKLAKELKVENCLFDLTAAGELGLAGLCAALEGIYGANYQQKFALSGRWEPEMACYAGGEGWQEADLRTAGELARSVIEARNLVNRPANMLVPEQFAQALADMVSGLPVQARIYRRDELAEKGLGGLLTVGDSSGHPPALAVLRYNGAPESKEVLGLVGKGVTVDTGGYSLKARDSMAGIKGDMAGGAAVAAAVRALAAVGAKVNAVAVVPTCENRISRESAVPGDVIRAFSGQTIAVDGTYPVDLSGDVITLLRAAQHNEYQEWEHDYDRFAKTAMSEGFPLVGKLFENIARVEKTHGDRFGKFADLMEKDQLFFSEVEVQWMCLHCGFVVEATAAPAHCPVCRHPQGYFVRFELAPWS